MNKLRQHWRFEGCGGSYLLVRSADLQAGESALDPDIVLPMLERWVSDPSFRLQILDLYQSLRCGFGIDSYRMTSHDLGSCIIPHIEEALRRGEVVALFRKWGQSAVGGAAKHSSKPPEDVARIQVAEAMLVPAAAAPPTSESQNLASGVVVQWIEVMLFDSAGDPVRKRLIEPIPTVDVLLVTGAQYPVNPLPRGFTRLSSLPPDAPSGCSLVFHKVADSHGALRPEAPPAEEPKIDDQVATGPYTYQQLLRSEFIAPQSGSLNLTNVFQLRRRNATVIEMEHFTADGAIFLPGFPPDSVELRDAAPQILGIEVLRRIFTTFDTGDPLLVAGHHPSLSQERADGVRLLLVGDRDGWAALSNDVAIPEDKEYLRNWSHEPLPDDDSWTVDTWKQIFDMYTRELVPAPPPTPPAPQRHKLVIVGDEKKNIYPVRMAEITWGYSQASRAQELEPLNPSICYGHWNWKPNLGPGDEIVMPETWPPGPLTDAGYHVVPVDGGNVPPPPPPPVPPTVQTDPLAVGCGARHREHPHKNDDVRRARLRHVETILLPGPALVCCLGSPCDYSTCEVYDPMAFDFVYLDIEPPGLERFRWVTSHQPYRGELSSLQLDLLTDESTVFRSIPGTAAAQVGDCYSFDVDPSDLDGIAFARLTSTGGQALEYLIPVFDFVTASPSNPVQQSPGVFVLALELVSRFADGTLTSLCNFDITVDDQSPIVGATGVQPINVSVGSTISIQARVQSPDHWNLDDAVLRLMVNSPDTFEVRGRHHDFKPPAWTNATKPRRILCEYFLSRLKDFTAEGMLTILLGSPRVLDVKDDIIPQNEDDRPILRHPTPNFGQFEISGTDLNRVDVDYTGTDARLIEIKTSGGPVMGRNPRVTGVAWRISDISDLEKDFADGGMDTVVVFSLPHGHREFFQGSDDHQHSFDWTWLYSYWWTNYFVLPPEDRDSANPPKAPEPFPPAGQEQDPFAYLTFGHRRFRSGAGISHQIAATGRPIMALFPLPGLDIPNNETSVNEWKDTAAFSEFVYELIALLRRQHRDYRPFERGKHLRRFGLAGHSRACTDAVLPIARAWTTPGSLLIDHFVDAIFLDPPEGSLQTMQSGVTNWVAQRKAAGQSPGQVRTCINTKAAGYVSAFGGTLPAKPGKECLQDTLDKTSVHAAPITFVFVPFKAWENAWRATFGDDVLKSRGMGGFTDADDAHMCACFYGLFMALQDSKLGT